MAGKPFDDLPACAISPILVDDGNGLRFCRLHSMRASEASTTGRAVSTRTTCKPSECPPTDALSRPVRSRRRRNGR